MKRLVTALTLALLVSLALGVSVANATHSNGEGPNHDFVRGTRQIILPEPDEYFMLHINAKSGPSGEDPQGHFFFKGEVDRLSYDFWGEVTCLTVEDDRATVGGVIEESKLPSPPGLPDPLEGTDVIIEIADNRDPDAPDQFSVLFLIPPPEQCTFFPVGAPTGQGNFIVHNATP